MRQTFLRFLKRFSSVGTLRQSMPFLLASLSFFALPACNKDSNHGDNNNSDMYSQPMEHPTGVPALSGMLDKSKLTMSSAIQVDLDRNVARLPLYKGTYNGSRVWFVRTDVSDSVLAHTLGLNFSPRLMNADNGCPSCIASVTSPDPVPGNAAVAFPGTVDFSPMRQLVPGATGFPPNSAMPGSVAVGAYSDLIRIAGSNVVYNAPIIATGNGPFDVSEAHINTQDRVVAIDTTNMTVDLQFIRAFAFGKDVFYFSMSATGAATAVIERATFVPAMATIPFANDDLNPKGARSSIFAFANGKTVAGDFNSQGLSHVILNNAPGGLSFANPDLFETLRQLGDARNVLGSFPLTITDPPLRNMYTPLWDLNIPVWSDAAVAAGTNYTQTDANTIRQLAAHGLVTNDGGAKLSSANFIVNCPVLGFADAPPTEDQAPRPAGF